MDELINNFHIDWKLLVAQLINFAIVVYVVWRFGLKSLLTTMDKRSAEIDRGLKDAKRIEDEIKQLAVTKDAVITEAKKQAEIIRREAEERAEAQRQETLTKVRGEAEKVLSEARQKFTAEREELLREVKQQAASLVVQAAAKVLGKITTPSLDKKVIEESLHEVSTKHKKG